MPSSKIYQLDEKELTQLVLDAFYIAGTTREPDGKQADTLLKFVKSRYGDMKPEDFTEAFSRFAANQYDEYTNRLRTEMTPRFVGKIIFSYTVSKRQGKSSDLGVPGWQQWKSLDTHIRKMKKVPAEIPNAPIIWNYMVFKGWITLNPQLNQSLEEFNKKAPEHQNKISSRDIKDWYEDLIKENKI